eukprot:CAMPEP_0172501988 /NCGR_PEP_ID=MMETSP1066-20121228/155563_1 /TAXON_ID=671091 /ORGANISM="Coscinodiscus wailesii, Strain CCMP2513" /LENGTH=97 /DNA_ID=CAMNT_0013277083 /DNA_START=93 /DNA_END=386 /DNA_ORIENTATION=+
MNLISRLAGTGDTLCYPGSASNVNIVSCNVGGDELLTPGEFAGALDEFLTFTRDVDFDVVLTEMEEAIAERRISTMRHTDAALEKVGHTVFSGKLVY